MRIFERGYLGGSFRLTGLDIWVAKGWRVRIFGWGGSFRIGDGDIWVVVLGLVGEDIVCV